MDNGSTDESPAVLEHLKVSSPHTSLVLHRSNLHHGPAMHDAAMRLETPLVLFVDSDCEVLRGGFVEEMSALLESDSGSYAVGKRVYMNRRGFDVPDPAPGTTPYIRPICLMLKRDVYVTLPPFERHGAPCLRNMTEAVRQGFSLEDFPIENFVRHEGRGTAGRFGYNLGFWGKLNHLLNKLGM